MEKKTINYREADQKKREAILKEINTIDPKTIVYSDETGIDDNEIPSNGWAPKGKRCYDTKKAVRKSRYNITAALNMGKLFSPFLFEGYSNRFTYQAYVEHVLVPELKPGMTIIIDNASFHKSSRIAELIEAAQCKLLFLPPYSPDFNPIEHSWSHIKKAIKNASQICDDFYTAAVSTLANLCAY